VPNIPRGCTTNCNQPFPPNRKDDCHRVYFVKRQSMPSYCCPLIITLQTQDWEVLDHPVYNPNLPLSDFHLFVSLTEAMRI